MTSNWMTLSVVCDEGYQIVTKPFYILHYITKISQYTIQCKMTQTVKTEIMMITPEFTV